MIQLQNVTKRYQDTVAVKDISFTCRENAVTGLIGVNGAGKTTILKAVAAIHLADEGRITVNGFDAENEAEKVKAVTGFVFENSLLPEMLTVKEFLLQCAKVRFCTAPFDVKSSFEKVIETFDLADCVSKKIGKLSKGYRQRVSFAQALIHEPSVLILDEPVSGLDPIQIIEMRNLIKQLGTTKTVLFSTHIMQEAEAVCQDIVFINKGRLIAKGSVGEITKSASAASLEEAFVRLCEQNGQVTK